MNLKTARKKKALTQTVLANKMAERAERSPSSYKKLISNWEHGKGVPSEPDMKILCEVLGFSEDMLDFNPQRPRSAREDFWKEFAADRLEPADADLIRENPILHDPLARIVKDFCEKIRKAVES